MSHLLKVAYLALAVPVIAQVSLAFQVGPPTSPPYQDPNSLYSPAGIATHFGNAVDAGAKHVLDTTDAKASILATLGGIFDFDQQGNQLDALNSLVFSASFGELYVEGDSGIASTPDLLPAVFSLQGQQGTFDGLQLWPVPQTKIASAIPVGTAPGAIAAWVYTGAIDSGPEVVGFATSLDMDAAGLFSCAGGAFCNFMSFVPLHVVDPTGPLSGQQIGEFLSGTLDGSLVTPGALLQWVEAQVNVSAFDVGVVSVPDNSETPCDEEGLSSCLSGVNDQVQSDFESILEDFDARVAENAKEFAAIADAASDATLTFVVLGTIEGAVVGAGTGSPGGPPGALIGAVGGAAVGLASGLITFLIGDGDRIGPAMDELADIHADAQLETCAALFLSALGAQACAEEHCPSVADQLEDQALEALDEYGC